MMIGEKGGYEKLGEGAERMAKMKGLSWRRRGISSAYNISDDD